jgi:hypothetical protein
MKEVKSRFRLNRLYSEVDPKKFTFCCQQLLKYEDELLPFLWNIHLHVTNNFEVKEDGSLNIKWDFAL